MTTSRPHSQHLLHYHREIMKPSTLSLSLFEKPTKDLPNKHLQVISSITSGSHKWYPQLRQLPPKCSLLFRTLQVKGSEIHRVFTIFTKVYDACSASSTMTRHWWTVVISMVTCSEAYVRRSRVVLPLKRRETSRNRLVLIQWYSIITMLHGSDQNAGVGELPEWSIWSRNAPRSFHPSKPIHRHYSTSNWLTAVLF